MPGRASRMASMIPSPAMRVASRRIAISRGLVIARVSSRMGSRSSIRDGGGELSAREHALDACRACRFLARIKPGPEHVVLAPLVARIEEQRRALRLAVHDEDGARLDYTRDIEELIRLAQRLLAGPF